MSGVGTPLLQALREASLALGQSREPLTFYQPSESSARRFLGSILPGSAAHNGSRKSQAASEGGPDLSVERQKFYDIVVAHLLVSYNVKWAHKLEY